jgi:predicted amidohydrolase YtcJ
MTSGPTTPAASTGGIDVVKPGDLLILDANRFGIDPPASSDATVVATLFGGEVVYHRTEP